MADPRMLETLVNSRSPYARSVGRTEREYGNTHGVMGMLEKLILCSLLALIIMSTAFNWYQQSFSDRQCRAIGSVIIESVVTPCVQCVYIVSSMISLYRLSWPRTMVGLAWIPTAGCVSATPCTRHLRMSMAPRTQDGTSPLVGKACCITLW